MPPASTAFDDHLTVGESPVTVGAGALFQEIRWTPAEICVTDHRVLFVPSEGGFVDVPRHQVQSIRSRPTTRRANREIVALGLLGGGLAVAAIAVGAVLASAGGLLVPLLALVGALGALATGAVVYRDVSVGEAHVGGGVDRVDDALGAIDGAAAALDDRLDADGRVDTDLQGAVDAHRRHEAAVADAVAAYPVVRWAAAGLGVLGATGLLALGAWAALVLTAVAVAAVGVAADGLGRLRALDDAGQRIHRQRSVCLYLVDGRTVRFRIDDDADIDRELSRLTARTTGDAVPGTGTDAAGTGGAGERSTS